MGALRTFGLSALCTYPPVTLGFWPEPGGEGGGDHSLIPGCVMVLGENVLRLRSGPDQVAAHLKAVLHLSFFVTN